MKRFLFTIFLISALCGAIKVRAQVYAEQVLNIGRNVLAMDDYVLAIQYFNQAAQAKPYLWDPYYFRALAKLMLDDYHGAQQDATTAIELNKYKYEAYRVRGFARMRLGQDSAAVADFDRGLEYAPSDKYFLYYKGGAQASMEDYAAADSTLSKLLKEYPGFEDGYNTRAQTHLLAGDTIAALTDIDKALSINSHMLQPRLMKADIALHRHEWKQACEQLDSAINLQPRDVSLYINRAFSRYNDDDWPGAMEDYNYALSIEPENYAALYNRALLRFQVQDLQGARADFSMVLSREPDDFPARYNRGLINLELGAYRQALADFNLIAGRYPRFYPVYYAISRAQQGIGNNKAAADNFFKANDLITRYTANPQQYRLDRPTIQSGSARKHSEKKELSGSDAPEDVMEHFNELVTISEQEERTPIYGEKLRGRVQDIEQRVEPEAPYSLTLIDPTDELRPRSGTYAELSEINAARWIASTLYLTNFSLTPSDADRLQSIFDYIDELYASEASTPLRPIDLLERAVALDMVKNYPAAIDDLNKALKLNPNFVSALLQRAYTHLMLAASPMPDMSEGEPKAVSRQAHEMEAAELMRQALNDYEAALKLDARLTYALLGKAYVLYENGDYVGALQSLDKALELNPDFGQALFNRALCNLRLGNRRQAQADLSAAGAAGIVQAYNLLKKL